MSGTHPTAAAGFGRAAGAYERGRPAYPQDAVDHIAAALRLGPGAIVLDLAAGTGKLTRMLAGTGASVVAVEPVDAMRAILSETAAGVEVRAGTAEAIPAADASLDAVTVAQAFHWFDAPRALAEIHRVLRPGGGLALVWNSFDVSVDWVAALQALVHPHRHGEPRYGRAGWERTIDATGLFGAVSERTFGLVQELDAAGLVDRIGSTSYIATLPDAERERLFAEVRALAAALPRPIELPYRTDTFVALRV